MIDFPITELLDESICTLWLERYLHPHGMSCPHCASPARRLFREQGYFPASRCRTCHGDYTLLTATVFDKTRQRPATLVLLLRGMAKGEPTARLARELGMSRKQFHTLRQRIQASLHETAPTPAMCGTAFEADELYQHAGGKSTPHRDPSDPPRRRANTRTGHGTYANDRPPIISVVSRETGEQRLWVCDHADTRTCRRLIAENVPAHGTQLSTDEWQSYRGSHPCHAAVRHGGHEWARDDDDDGRREVHCNRCEGAGAGLRTYRRAFRGVHKQYLHRYVATYDAMLNTKRVTPMLIRRMCVRSLPVYAGYT